MARSKRLDEAPFVVCTATLVDAGAVPDTVITTTPLLLVLDSKVAVVEEVTWAAAVVDKVVGVGIEIGVVDRAVVEGVIVVVTCSVAVMVTAWGVVVLDAAELAAATMKLPESKYSPPMMLPEESTPINSK